MGRPMELLLLVEERAEQRYVERKLQKGGASQDMS